MSLPTMDSMFYCGMSLCVSYYQDRCPVVYPDPYYLCSYHGLETDLLNLTACWGYELWRLSTTCTLVIESVKATSVIFLLGVGSLVCYKLYNHYRKKFGGSSAKKKLRLLRWGSEELIESNTDLDSDLQNIETKYFGPEEINTEDATECSDGEVEDCSSYVESPSPRSDNAELFSELSDSEVEMGNMVPCPYEPVVYSVHAGINFPNDILADDFSHHPPRSHSKNFLIPSKSRHRRPRRFNFGALLAQQNSKDDANVIDADTKFQIDSHLKKGSSAVEDFNDEWFQSRNGSEADIESLGSPSLTTCDSDLEEILGKESLWNLDSDTASLNANFSPRSLQERSCLFDRMPPDGSDCQPLQHESYSKAPYVDEEVDSKISIKEPFMSAEIDAGKRNSTEMSTSSKGHKGCLVRDHSFDSDVSEISLDISVQDNIGGTTMANIDHLLSNLHQIKQSCLNLDADIVNLRVFKGSDSSSAAKSSTSDSSEHSVNHSGSAMEIVEKHKSRASFKGLLESNAFIPEISSESSFAERSSGVRASGDASLEWESPVVNSSKDEKLIEHKLDSVPETTLSGNIAPVDSGSDFGTPLTSESPDLNCLIPSSSSASLEWDEEFEDRKDDAKIIHRPIDRFERTNLQLPVNMHEIRKSQLSTNFESLQNILSVPILETPLEMTPSPSDERIIPGQSRECSPGDTLSVAFCASKYIESENIKKSEMRNPIPQRTSFSWTSENHIEENSVDTLKGSPPLLTGIEESNVADTSPLWPSTESGFGDDTIYRKKNMEAKVEIRKKDNSEENKANRDSAYFEDTELTLPRFQENVSDRWDIILYSEAEWRGHTSRAATIREGYMAIPSSLRCSHLRRIRGDNYCAIRASLFQVLAHNLPILEKYGGLSRVMQKLKAWTKKRYSWLCDWSFGNRLPYSKETCLRGFQECLGSLDKLASLIALNSRREEFLVNQLNSDPDLDVQLMEAVKLLMMVNGIELYEDISAEKETPIFAILLYARETSDTPKSFMTNHLNLMGDSGGLEQVEMYLLGYTLGVILKVVRPSSYGRDDYICHYPEPADDHPEINLVAEDDRHYNIIVS